MDEQWTRSATEAATSSAQTLLQLSQAADVFGDSPIAVPALRETMCIWDIFLSGYSLSVHLHTAAVDSY